MQDHLEMNQSEEFAEETLAEENFEEEDFEEEDFEEEDFEEEDFEEEDFEEEDFEEEEDLEEEDFEEEEPIESILDRLDLLEEVRENLYVLRAVTESGETAVSGLFQENPADEKGVAWIDVSVHPDYRGSDAVHRLLQHAEEYFLKRGRAYLQVRCCGKVEKLEGLYDLLVREAFLPVLVLGGMVRYRMYNWFGSDFVKKAAQLEAYIERVQTIEDWEDERLQAFLRTGVDLPRDCFDAEFCRFYMVNGQIQAVLCAERVNDQTLFFHQLVFAPKCPKQIALLALLASLIRQAEKHKLEESAVLVVQSPLQSLLEGMREQFGTPEMEYLYQEYLYPFERRSPKADVQADGRRLLWSMEKTECRPAELRAYSLYQGLDDAVFSCMRRPSGMLMDKAGLERWGENGTVDSPKWRKELNAWWERIGREQIGQKKPLPFDVYAEQRKTIQIGTGMAPQDRQKMQSEQKEQSEQPTELEYAVLTHNTEDFAKILPSYLQERCAAGEFVIVTGSDAGGSVLAYAVFSYAEFPKETMYLEYIYVVDAYRGCGLAEKVFAHAKQAFEKAKAKGILTKQVNEAVQAEGLHRFLKGIGFLPVSLSVSVRAYSLQDLYDTALMQIPEALMQRMPKLEAITDANDIRLRNLANESREQGHSFHLRPNDVRFSRFHIKDGKICAAMFMEQPAESVLLYQGMWFARGYDSPQMRAALLVSVLEEAKASLREDALLVFQFDAGWKLGQIEKLLGEGEVMLRMYEYALPMQSGRSE